MKIDIIARDGSPLGVSEKTIYGEDSQIGVGGAELALLTMCKGWHDRGDEIVLYNNPRIKNGSCFEQRDVNSFDPNADRDVLIIFRSPNPLSYNAKGLKCWWSCDQYTIDNFKDFSSTVSKIVTISPFHSAYFENTYGIKNSIPIDLPVRTWEYEKNIEKIPNRLIFTSVPDRGLAVVAQTFPKIKELVPDASLVITSDYRLWGVQSPSNGQFVRQFMGMKDVEFLGAVKRDRLIEEQMKAQIHYYPSNYNELFCIAVAESQVAGTLPITTSIGALASTNMGIQINGSADSQSTKDEFVEKTAEVLKSPDAYIPSYRIKPDAIKRFSLENILKQWDSRVFSNG